jgi:hypothetical protein
MLELIRAVIAQTGPADVMLSTWTFGIRDAEMAAWLIRSGDIKSFKFLVDHSFPVREHKYCKRIQELFGNDSIVLSKVHAKFATIRVGDWNICLTGSMNLNRNPRWEHFTLWDSKQACDFLDGIRAELQGMSGSGWDAETPVMEAAFKKAQEQGLDPTWILIEQADARSEGKAIKAAVQAAAKPPAEPLPDPSSIEIPGSVSEMLEAQYRLASVQEQGANQDHSWVAAGQFAALKVKLYRELLAARKAEGSGKLTEAQYFARLEGEASQLATPHLEVFVREYLKRHPGLRLASG